MFIELTDHLRCPADHPESFLVLIPDLMDGRRVVRGTLGCPVCQAEYLIADGVVRFGAGHPPGSPPATSAGSPDAAAVHAFLGIEGPGGYVGLIGDSARVALGLGELLPGVHLVAVNPPAETRPGERMSVLRAARLPLKGRAFRGMVVGLPEALDAGWQRASIGALLPGLRATGTGPVPDAEGFEVLGEAGGWWVGRRGAK